jgi:hypothetical protein
MQNRTNYSPPWQVKPTEHKFVALESGHGSGEEVRSVAVVELDARINAGESKRLKFARGHSDGSRKGSIH